MNCETANTQMVAYLKGELNDGQKRRLEEHLARCPACRAELEKARNVMVWVDAASDDTVMALVEDIVATSIDAGASDIHFEPSVGGILRVRVRIDGVLQDREAIPAAQRPGVIARLKMLAGMNVGQTALPQEGRHSIDYKGKDLDLRMSCVPFTGGEGIVARIVDKGDFPGLEMLGFTPDQLEQIRSLLSRPNGLILVSGPVGSGKTCTCYSMLQEVRSDKIKLLSVENPVIHTISDVNQIQVNPKAGFTGAEAMKAVLRSDPDVIFVNGLDDPETTKAFCMAALTGHLVIVEVQADSSEEACQGILNSGVETDYLASTLIASISQRLARRLCPSCKKRLTDFETGAVLLRSLGISSADFQSGNVYEATGCDQCRQTGYRGRVALRGMLVTNEASTHCFANGDFSPKPDWNYTSLLADARANVLAGHTSAEEARRVLF